MSVRDRLLALLKVPERPDPPPGAGGQLETFRAERGFFHYSVLMWFPKQLAALAGLLFSLSFFRKFDDGLAGVVEPKDWHRFIDKIEGADIGLLFLRLDMKDILLFFESLAILTWVSQLLFTGLLLKLSWELRWYMVGERSLRIRHGLWSVREQTMTIANIQNMIVRQGPLQRYFGISDLEIHTAGGGGSGSDDDTSEKKDSFHVGRLRGLKDASALRNKIRRRLQAVQSGESEGAHEARAAGDGDAGATDLGGAALQLLSEARALRRAATRG